MHYDGAADRVISEALYGASTSADEFMADMQRASEAEMLERIASGLFPDDEEVRGTAGGCTLPPTPFFSLFFLCVCFMFLLSAN
jgi:hypothetical protein